MNQRICPWNQLISDQLTDCWLQLWFKDCFDFVSLVCPRTLYLSLTPDVRLWLAVCLCSCDGLPLDSWEVSRWSVLEEDGEHCLSLKKESASASAPWDAEDAVIWVITQLRFDDVWKDDTFSVVNTVWSLFPKEESTL